MSAKTKRPKPAPRSTKPAARKAKPAPQRKVKPSPKLKVTSSKSTAPVPAKAALVAVLPKVTHLQFTANSQALLLARQSTKTLTLYDLETRAETPPLKALPTFSTIAMSADSRYIAMGTSTGIVAVDSAQSGKTLWKTKAADTGGNEIEELAFSLDASLLFAATAGDNAWLRIYNAAKGDLATGFDTIQGATCRHLALSNDGLFLAHAEIRSNSVLVWHLPSRQVAHCIRLPIPNGPIVGLAFGATVRQLHIAQKKHLSTWNGETGQLVLDFEIPPAQSLAVLLEGNILATTQSASEENPKQFLHMHSAPTGRLRRSIALPPKLALSRLIASPNTLLLALPSDKHTYLWRAEKLL